MCAHGDTGREETQLGCVLMTKWLWLAMPSCLACRHPKSPLLAAAVARASAAERAAAAGPARRSTALSPPKTAVTFSKHPAATTP